eukprot:comp23936_c0_seq1/m.42283 comp23936_c0_seq1/g.42283  ORF comp23936_c0_seq1/g.42283 comp23936_c0_seq1/m.42283 type:complete len:239 (-) comp23936_c0_seq1:194-910(-)
MPEAHLVVEPKDRLAFSVGPGNVVRPQHLQLSNARQECVYFKIKTTAPKKYCVRPNAGKVEPGSTVQVQILLQAGGEQELDAASIVKDKFQVQTVVAGPDADPDVLFKTAKPEDLGQEKLRCVLEHEQSGAAPAVSSPAQTTTEKATPADTAKTPAETESELAKALKLNSQLKEQNSRLQDELQQARTQGLRHRSTGAKGSSEGPSGPATVAVQRGQVQWPLLMIALLLGWLLAHFML